MNDAPEHIRHAVSAWLAEDGSGFLSNDDPRIYWDVSMESPELDEEDFTPAQLASIKAWIEYMKSIQ